MPVSAPENMNPLLEKLWNSGIMHVTFSAQRISTGEDAVRNVERAEDLGMISGVRGIAGWFLQPDLFQKLALAGVDYIAMPAISAVPEKQDAFFGESNSAQLNQCIELCRKWEVTPVLEVPILRQNQEELEQIINEFGAKGIRNVLYYAIADEFQAEGLSGVEIIHAAAVVEEIAHRSNVRYVWLPAISVAGDLKSIVESGPRTAGDVSIRVEPGGSVFTPRGPLEVAGNLSKEPFSEIWTRDVFRRYRERVESPTRCEICPDLEVCGADCPGEPSGWARGAE
jgi:radical SAM protein with 4Fe4S-binding SPASM domain